MHRTLMATLLMTATIVASPVLAGAGTARAEESCNVTGNVMARADMEKSLHERGYTDIRGLSTHNGCYEAKGIDKNGKRFELEVNGQTGEIVNAE